MAIEINQKHPICDTDLWIDLSSVDKLFYVFALSNHAYISDAVKYELLNKKEEDFNQFGHAFKNYQLYKEKKELFRIDLNNDKFFSEDDKKAVKRKFTELGIPYCFETWKYTSPKKNLGETVSVIFAGILEIPVILSNDNEVPNIILQHYSWLKSYNIHSLLNELGKDISEINSIYSTIKDRKVELDTTPEHPLMAWKKKYQIN